MRSSRWLPRTLLFLFPFLFPLLFLSPADALAADDTTENEYEEQARVLRVTLVKGDASLLRAGSDEWETLRPNLPLVEGDRLTTGRDARVEIQVDARNFVRLGAGSTLKVVTLRDEGIAFSVTEGTATFRLARFDRDREYFEVDAPKSTMAAEKTGLYRVDVNADGEVRVTVRDEGRARIYSESSGFVLRNNRTARLTNYGTDEADWEMASAPSFDEWDSWNDERERYLAARLRHEGRDRYYDAEVWGAEELDAYGDWEYTRDYGYVWRPHATVVNNYNNWAPYRYGHWRWCAPYGWTWVPDEDWGWAPYHYGRWVHVNNNWCWAPRGYGYNYGRARWRPALVAFVYVDTSHGRNLCWYPLTHGQRDPRGRFWARDHERLSALRPGQLAHLRRANPAFLRAVTSTPEREFGARSMRARPAPADIAQRAINGEPVRGRLPIAPAGRTGPARFEGRAGRATPPAVGNATAGSREGLSIVRPFPEGVPTRTPRERLTGAAARTPGVPLDESLRRTRVFNNREPRVARPALGEGSTPPGGQDGTGAVARPGRWERRPPADDARPPRDTGGSLEANPAPREQPESIKPRRNDEDPIIRTPRVRDREGAGERPSEPRERRERQRDNRPPDSPPVRRAEPPQPRREAPPPDRPERSAPAPQPHQPQPRQEAPRPSPPPRQEAPRQERPAAPPPARERQERKQERQQDNQL